MDRDWIVKVVDIVAPRSLGDAVIKSLVLLGMIIAVDILVVTTSGRLQHSLLDEAAVSSAVALPFVVGWMTVLFHQRRLQQRLSNLATTDMLTGLPNRRDFMARAQAALEREGTGVLLLLDADHFKRINDRWGHGAGDAALMAIGCHLRAVLRSDDILGRLGGEEFAAFLPSTRTEEIARLGQRLCAPIPVGGSADGLTVTLSVGAASACDGSSLDRLMARADGSLYRAKSEGRARMHVSEKGVGQERAA